MEPGYVFDSVAERTVTSAPAVPLRVIVCPLAPMGNEGLSCRLTVYLGTGPSNCRTKRSKPTGSVTRTAVTLAAPVEPPDASVQAKAGRWVPGATGGVTGGGEMRGGDATELPESADGEEVVFAAGVPTGPT